MAHFCVQCGKPLQPKLIEGAALESCEDCGFVLWRDPKVVTMVVVETDAGVILGRRGIEPGYGLWCLPGGFVNHDEHPADAAARECQEEIGAEVEIVELLGVHHIRKQEAPSMVGIAYRARLKPGAVPQAGSEMLEIGVFAPPRLPELVFPSHAAAVNDWIARGVSRAERL